MTGKEVGIQGNRSRGGRGAGGKGIYSHKENKEKDSLYPRDSKMERKKGKQEGGDKLKAQGKGLELYLD